MPSVPTVIHFEGLELGSAEDIIEQLERGITTRPSDQHPFEWAVRFAAEGPINHALLSEAISIMVERAVQGGGRPGGLVSEVVRLASNVRVRKHGPALLAWLDADTQAWSDAEVSRLLDDLFSAEGASLPPDGKERIFALARRPRCFATALCLLLHNWPWHAAALIRDGAREAWSRGEPELATVLTLIWDLEHIPYRAELVHAIASSSPELQAAYRDAIRARFSAEQVATLEAFFDDCRRGTEPETAAMARRLVEIFTAFSRSGNPDARALVIHPRDLDPQHPWAARAAEDQAALDAHLASARSDSDVIGVGQPRVLASRGEAELMEAAIDRSAPPQGSESVLIYRIGHRFKVGLERPAPL